MKRCLLFIFFLTLIVPLGTYAQQQTVTGVVRDATTGIALPGVSVQVTGTTAGAVTDATGKYQLNIPANGTQLSFTFMGYLAKQEPFAGRHTIDIQLQPDTKALGEVIVVGYGTQRKSDLTSSITKVDLAGVKSAPVTGVEQALQGRAAGVTVTSASGVPGSPVMVRIRGIGTVNNNDPLYVVDGVPVSGMNYLNPADIESMEILKDASATAIYGSRAANGVVLITTRKGKAGKSQITLDAYYGLNSPWKDYKPAGRDEYLYMVKNVYGETTDQYKDALAQYNKGYNTNWWKETVKKNAPVQSYNLGVYGGTDKVTYAISGGYFDQKGIIDPSDFNRISFRANTSAKAKEWLTIGQNLSISNEQTNVIGDEIPGIMGNIIPYDPLIPVLDPSKDQSDRYSKWATSATVFGSSPKAILAREVGKRNTLRMVGDVFANVNILKSLVFTTRFGLNISRADEWTFSPTYYMKPSDLLETPQANSSKASNNYYNWTNTLNWTETFGRHRLNVLAGISAERSRDTYLNGSKQGQLGNEENYWFLDAGNMNDKSGGGAARWSLMSQFARANYSYADKYLFSASVRRDGSSNFGTDKQFGVFPAVSGGWVISREQFFKDIDLAWLTNVKLRAGWGQVGNQNIPNGAYTTFVANSLGRNYLLGNGTSVVMPGYSMDNLGNGNIKWETAEQSNVGLELGLFKNSLKIEAEYFNRKTRDMLIAMPTASMFGVPYPWVNAGNVSNKGFELSANYEGDAGAIHYAVGGNISTYKNEVLSLGGGQPYVEDVGWQLRVLSFSRTAEGHSIGEFYGWKTDGVFQSQADVDNHKSSKGEVIQPNAGPGDFRFNDLNGDGVINDADKTAIGSPHPKFTYGANINLSYKAFDFSLFLQGVSGNKLFNATKYLTKHPLGFNNVEAGAAYNAWTPENHSNEYPKMSVNDPNDNYRASDWYVENGSYLRIKNIQLGYTLPEALIKRMGLQQLRIYVAAQNLFTFTKYTGLDPEVGAYQLNSSDQNKMSRLMGVDNYTYPQVRTMQVGASLKF